MRLTHSGYTLKKDVLGLEPLSAGKIQMSLVRGKMEMCTLQTHLEQQAMPVACCYVARARHSASTHCSAPDKTNK